MPRKNAVFLEEIEQEQKMIFYPCWATVKLK
jgi:hypothetical protein